MAGTAAKTAPKKKKTDTPTLFENPTATAAVKSVKSAGKTASPPAVGRQKALETGSLLDPETPEASPPAIATNGNGNSHAEPRKPARKGATAVRTSCDQWVAGVEAASSFSTNVFCTFRSFCANAKFASAIS